MSSQATGSGVARRRLAARAACLASRFRRLLLRGRLNPGLGSLRRLPEPRHQASDRET